MSKRERRIEQLKRKYGAKGIDSAARLSPHDFLRLMEWRDELDQNYAKLWLNYTYGGLYSRQILSDRIRVLVVVGQCVAQGEMEDLESQIRGALAHGATPREILEVILQVTVYIGNPKVSRAARVFRRVISALGRMDEITKTQLPLDGGMAHRSLDKERPTWRVADKDFPRRDELMQKYGWEGISAGLRLQPTHNYQTVERLDRVDQHFLKIWLDFIYAGMYVRGILDDKTRILCVIGVCVVLDEMTQGENHLRAALMFGATPREIYEVILQSTILAGMPRCMRAAAMLERILEEQGRITELTETQLPLPT